jgi:nitrogen regulatory protein P-II 1
MKRLDIIIRPDKLENLKNILNHNAIGGITVYSAMGCGNQKGNADIESFKGLKVANMNLIPKITVIAVVEDDKVDELLSDIHSGIATGKVGDGKVFVSEVVEAMRIRTGERGRKAL